MSFLDFNKPGPEIKTAVVTDTELMIYLKDGRRVSMPLWWSPRLFNATPEERNNFYIMPFGDALGWDDIDEHLSVRGIILSGPMPGAVPPAYVTAQTSNHAEGSVG